MTQINFGKFLEERGAFKVDVRRLIETRLVVQANSGGGKSYLLRKLVEELHGHVQIIVLDPEGEFSTLRERFDFVVAGKGGDVAVDPRYADAMARKVLDLRANLICDLYELRQHDRVRFVGRFLDAMVNAPKDLWHPCVVILDEAHLFAPEKSRAESLSAVIDMESRGRKRGFCLVVATQRPAKLDKDVVAECQNKLIGLGNTDIDRERGAKELGFTDKAKVLTLRDLDAGEFYAVGPAFNKRGANLVKIGEVKTTHPEGGGRMKVKVPAPTTKVKAHLAKLADLPREAEEEARTVGELKLKVRELEKKLKAAPVEPPDERVIETAYENGLRVGRREEAQRLSELTRASAKFLDVTAKHLEPIRDAMSPLMELVVRVKSGAPTPEERNLVIESTPRYSPAAKKAHEVFVNPRHTFVRKEPSAVMSDALGLCERKILGFLSLRPGEFFTVVQVGAMTGYRHSSGGFNNALSRLNKEGFIQRQPGRIALDPNAQVAAIIGEQPHRLEDWINKLGACERAIYQLLLRTPTEEWPVTAVADETGYSAGSGGFNNALSRLSTLGLIVRAGKGFVKFNPEVSEAAKVA